MRARRGVAGAAAVVAVMFVAIVFAARAGSSSTNCDVVAQATDRRVVLDARSKTVAADTVRMTGRVTVAGTTFVEFDGVSDVQTGAGDQTIRAPLSQLGPGVDDLVLRFVAIDATNVFIDPGPEVTLPAGKHWVAVTLRDDGAVRDLSASVNAAAWLDLLAGVTGDACKIRAEPVDGVEATRYDVTIDFQTLLDRATKGDTSVDVLTAAQIRETMRAFEDDIADGAVWIDEDGLLRRFEYGLNHGGQRETTSFEFSDFGAPVEVRQPPADDVVPLKEAPRDAREIIVGPEAS